MHDIMLGNQALLYSVLIDSCLGFDRPMSSHEKDGGVRELGNGSDR